MLQEMRLGSDGNECQRSSFRTNYVKPDVLVYEVYVLCLD